MQMSRDGEGPPKIKPKSLADYFEVLTRTIFQSGMSWRVIERKWDGFREAFSGFDPKKVTRLTPQDVDRLVKDSQIIRNRRKIEATVANAEIILHLDRQKGGFKEFLRSQGGFENTVSALRSHFKFLGDLGAYYFLWVVSEPVPSYEDWCASRGIKPMRPRPRRK